MAIGCKICIASKGLRGDEIDKLPQNEKEYIEHMEKVHHMSVIQEGETQKEVEKRFIEKYPEAKTCPECIAAGASWTK